LRSTSPVSCSYIYSFFYKLIFYSLFTYFRSILSYINKIDTYTFEGNDKNWDSEEFLEESYDANVDGVDVMVEAMLSFQ